jgi:hypothetical protein
VSTSVHIVVRHIELRRQWKMSSPEKLTCKGTLRQVYIRVYPLEIADFLFLVYIQSCWYFQPSFGICTLLCCPSALLSGSTLPPSPLPCVNK